MTSQGIADRMIRKHGLEEAYCRAYARSLELQHIGRDWGGRDRWWQRLEWARIALKIQRRHDALEQARKAAARQRLLGRPLTRLDLGKRRSYSSSSSSHVVQ